MSDGLSKLKLYISTFILTFMGMISVNMSFLNTFYSDRYYESAIWLLIAFIFSAVFSASVVFIKYKWIVPLSVIIIICLFIYANFYEVIGGFGRCFNIVADAASKYLKTDVLYVYMSKKMDRYEDTAMFCNIVAVLMPLIYSYTIYYRKTTIIPVLITMAAFGIPVLFEVFPVFLAVLFGIVYCIQMTVVASVPGKISENAKFVSHIVSIAFGFLVLIAGGIVNLIVPSDEFKRSGVFDELKTFIFNQELPEWNKNPITGTIGGGSLGHVDELRFQGDDVLEIELPNKKEKIYIKGYIGGTYDGNKWIEPDMDKDLFSDMLEDDYPQQTMVSTYLEQLAKWDGNISGYKAKMKLKYLTMYRPYHFIHIYSVFNEELAYEQDMVISSGDAGTWVEYFMPDEKSFYKTEDEIAGIMTGTRYEKLSERYEEYVYENYLEVNTSMEDKLREQWESYDVETAEDRFELAKDIQEYLDDNFTYTTSPGKLPDGKDFIEYFLAETKEGYCTYFATSAVMMFRSAGVPARYVEGYAFYGGSDAEVIGEDEIFYYNDYDVYTDDIEYAKVTVKDYHAHAWVQFYIDGIGWIDYEVTPGGGTADVQPEVESQTETTQNQETTATQPITDETTTDENSTTSGDETDETTTQVQETTGEDDENGNNFRFRIPDRIVKILVGFFIGILIIALMLFIIIISHGRIKHEREAINEEDKTKFNGRSINMYYGLFERLMKKCGYKRSDGMTYMDFAVLVEEECYAVGESEAQKLTRIFEKINYSDEKVTVDEINEAEKIYTLIRQRIYENMGIMGKFIFTYILNY